MGTTTKAASFGWAMKDKDGLLLVRTVSPTRQAALVNWLYTYARQFVPDAFTEAQIEGLWAKFGPAFKATLIKVRIEESDE